MNKKIIDVKIIISALLVDLEIAVERQVWVAPQVLFTQLNALLYKAGNETQTMFWKTACCSPNDSKPGVYVKVIVGNEVVYQDEVTAPVEKDAKKIQKTDEEIAKEISSLFEKAKEPISLKIISSREFREQKVS